MTRRISPSQFNSMMRQAQQKQRAALDKFKRDVRSWEQRVNRDIDRYNREVRVYNARVRANRQRLANELSRLAHRTTTTRYVTFRTSVTKVLTAYESLERAATEGRLDGRYNEFLDLSEREAANNAGLMNALEGNADVSEGSAPDSADSPVTAILRAISPELGDRWLGAVYSLSPRNPDAARHFCTSSRELITSFLLKNAPDDRVFAAMPGCERTSQQTPTRRARIQYILRSRDMDEPEVESFVEADMDNVVTLFHEFNEGTHGSAATFDLPQLQALRKRVEDGIMFLSRLVS